MAVIQAHLVIISICFLTLCKTKARLRRLVSHWVCRITVPVKFADQPKNAFKQVHSVYLLLENASFTQ